VTKSSGVAKANGTIAQVTNFLKKKRVWFGAATVAALATDFIRHRRWYTRLSLRAGHAVGLVPNPQVGVAGGPPSRPRWQPEGSSLSISERYYKIVQDSLKREE
jgi:hypothetical protein